MKYTRKAFTGQDFAACPAFYPIAGPIEHANKHRKHFIKNHKKYNNLRYPSKGQWITTASKHAPSSSNNQQIQQYHTPVP
jgi:hypothetical protein